MKFSGIYSLTKLNYVYTIWPGEVSGPIIQTHKLDLPHTISSISNLQLVNQPRVILHWTSLLVGFCFRLQSGSLRRLLLRPQYHRRRTLLGHPTSRSPGNTASAPAPMGRATSGGVGGEEIWPLQMLSTHRDYNTCAHTLSQTQSRRDRWHAYKVTHSEHTHTCSLAHSSQWGNGRVIWQEGHARLRTRNIVNKVASH